MAAGKHTDGKIVKEKYAKLGERIKAARAAKSKSDGAKFTQGLLVGKFQELTGHLPEVGTISKWENGKTRPESENLHALARVLEVSPEEEIQWLELAGYLIPAQLPLKKPTIQDLERYWEGKKVNEYGVQQYEQLKRLQFPNPDAPAVNYLIGSQRIYDLAAKLAAETQHRLRSMIFMSSAKAPPTWIEAVAKMLAANWDRENNTFAEFHTVLAWNPEKPESVGKEVPERIEAGLRLFSDYRVLEIITVKELKLESNPIFDMLIVDDKHAIINFSTSEKNLDAPVGIAFENQKEIVGALAAWFDAFVFTPASEITFEALLEKSKEVVAKRKRQ